MCGIIAISRGPRSSPESDVRDQLARGLNLLAHRGPDGHGTFGSAGQGVGMCRLRVRSAPADAVPFTSDGSGYALNGEVYVTADGHIPDGGLAEARALTSDRLGAVDGMWASASLGPDGDLRLTRDPFGIKPLMMRRQPDTLTFASEVRTLLAVTGPATIRQQAIAQFLLTGRVVDGGSFWDGVEAVSPGATLSVRDGQLHSVVLTAPNLPAGPVDLRAAIAQAVERTLVSDRSLGMALSGGLDSTIIAYEVQAAGIEDFDTVSLTPRGDSDGVKSLDELSLPAGTHRSWRHHHIDFGPEHMLRHMADAVSILGTPTAMTSVPLYLAVARAASEAGIVVLLVGEGADELFGGYRSYLQLDRTGTAFDFYHKQARAELVAELLGPELLVDAQQALRDALPKHPDVCDSVGEFERTHSLVPLLERTDLLTMACTIEARTPFLHGGVADHAGSLAWEEKCAKGQTKKALRQAYADSLPQFANEFKTPFRAPWARWCQHELAEQVRQLLLGATAELSEVGIRPRGVELVCERMGQGQPEALNMAFTLTTIAMWLRDRSTGTVDSEASW